jgi:hypothetical protein
MPSTEDIADQQDLLQAHRQTLHVLLTQQAQFGSAYTPPAVIHGIHSARSAIATIKQTLHAWGTAAADVPGDQETTDTLTTPNPLGQANTPTAGGDVIIATIGAGAQGVAVGKQIQQTIGDPSANPASDSQTIAVLIANLEQTLATSQLDSAAQSIASFQLRLLAGELRKEVGSVPSANTISQVADWLIQYAPALLPDLNTLFGTPAVLRVLRRADTALDSWLQQRFGI